MSDLSKTVALHHYSLDLLDALHRQDGQVLDEYAFVFVLLELKFCIGLGPEQITDFFVIDFDVRATNEEALFDIGLVVNEAVDMLEGLRDDTLVFFIR